MSEIIRFTFSFQGNESDNHKIDLYDVSQALTGFQRTLALTTHLILNNKVITQAPSLKNATIYSIPPEEGSWKMTVIISSALFTIGTAPQNSPLGHLLFSAYDYVISESIGTHVDYNKSLVQQYHELPNNIPKIKQHQLDSIIEKCNNSFKEMHRPIYQTNTSNLINIYGELDGVKIPISSSLDYKTYTYLKEEIVEKEVTFEEGYITSYNINTFRGRIYVPKEGRAVPFDLKDDIRSMFTIELIVNSLRDNALTEKAEDKPRLSFMVFKIITSKGTLKSYIVNNISILNK